MIELQAHIHKEKIDIASEQAGKFQHPIVFYMAHKNDQRFFFITFVIADFLRKELAYITTYTPDNIEKVENHKDKELFRMSRSSAPHCSFRLQTIDNFLTFNEKTSFFYQVNIETGIVKVYTGKDISLNGLNRIKMFGSTLYKDPQNKNFFYLTAVQKNIEDKECALNFYKTATDLNSLEKVFGYPVSNFASAPHVTKKYKKYLFNSEFNKGQYKNKKTGEVFDEMLDLTKYIYEKLYKKYCDKMNQEFSLQEFYRSNSLYRNKSELDLSFKAFCDTKGRDIFEICKNNPDLDFSVLPGKISLVDLEKQAIDFFETTYCTPAHFEIDERNDYIYSSSHNFLLYSGQRYFLGPAAIDKFKLENGKLTKVSTFSNPSAYRFTTHKLFSFEGKDYICSFGQPNRLYFIDAQTLKTAYYDDIGENVLSGQEDIGNFLNYNNLEPITLVALEVSSDGELLFLVSQKYLYIYNFTERKIVAKIDYHPDISLPGGANLREFYSRTIHCDYLK